MEGSSGIDLYEYSSLADETSIRLVTILPGNFNDPLQINIEHKSLVPPDEIKSTRLSVKEIKRTLTEGWYVYETMEGRIIFQHGRTWLTRWVHPDPKVDRALYDPIPDGRANLSVPVYEALSYAWGPPQKDETIQVVAPGTQAEQTSLSGSLHQTRILRITRNLADALRHLRLRDRPRIMWIDAICIDQSNTQERSGQVQRMGRIYTLASRVVAWLGPSFPDSSLALKALRMLGEEIEITMDNIFMPSPRFAHPNWCNVKQKLPFTLDEFAAIAQLCKAKYMERLWVVQELQLASAKSIIMCGNEGMEWPSFRRAILRLAIDVRKIQYVHDTIEPAYWMCLNTQNEQLGTLLYRHNDRRCTDARDKVYGLLNLVDQTVRKYVVVDYSAPLIDVFKQVFLESLAQEKRLTLLRYARPSALSNSTWPSWLPDWSQKGSITIPHSFEFQPSSISAAQAKQMDLHKLEVTGISFATVSAVTRVRVRDDFSDIVETLRKVGLESSNPPVYPNGESRVDAYLQTIAVGRVEENTVDSIYPTMRELRDEIARLGSCLKMAESVPMAGSLLTDVNNRCLFTMANGYVGLCSGRLHPGDEAFIILGCATPMILKPTPSGEYRVVGDCYIHGAMHGEAVLGPVPYPWKVELRIGDETRHWTPSFRNAETGMGTEDDPRLASTQMPAEWEPIEFEWTPADPLNCRKFRNRDTGQVINSDPRLFPEALLERGVALRTITLI
ncbi:HET-domain-containing protein [Nemania sp. FL0031]|nr:HET-domain-containing protein [Nemania sp. FL0031]